MRILKRDGEGSGVFRANGAGLCLLETDNVLSGDRPEFDAWLEDADAPAMAVAWSGGLGDSLFAKDPMSWMAPGRSALKMFCDAISGRLSEAGRTLVVRPHCRHAVSDPTAATTFFAERAKAGFGVALDVHALFEPDMVWRWEDHLSRAFETLGPLASVLILASPGEGTDSDGLPVRLSVGAGAFDAGVLGSLVRDRCRSDVLIVFPEGDAAAQAGLLGL